MNKGNKKNIPSPAPFSIIACCLMAAIFLGKPIPVPIRNHYVLLLGPEKHNINVSGSKLYTGLKKIKFASARDIFFSMAFSSNQNHLLPDNSLGAPLNL